MRRGLVLVLFLASAAGCLEGEPVVDHGDLPAVRPDGWDGTPEFVPFNGFRAHSADQTLQARAPDAWVGGRPAACQAYQTGQHTLGDECRIVAGPPEYWYDEDGPRPEWYVEARWDGSGQDLFEEERNEDRRTVVIYDASARPVGHVPRAIAFAIE